MSEQLEFFVKGKPIPYGLSRAGPIHKKPEYAKWKTLVAWKAKQVKACMIGMIPPPYEVTAIFYLPQTSRDKEAWPTVGDWDNYFKGINDGLQCAGVIENDRDVVKPGPDSCKKFANGHDEGVLIRVKHVPPLEI